MIIISRSQKITVNWNNLAGVEVAHSGTGDLFMVQAILPGTGFVALFVGTEQECNACYSKINHRLTAGARVADLDKD